MSSESRHFLGSLPKAMLGLGSHRLANFFNPTDEPTVGAIADVVPLVSVFLATISDVEVRCFYAVIAATDEPVECAAAATPETDAVILSSSPVSK
jgi:hypothetical protein